MKLIDKVMNRLGYTRGVPQIEPEFLRGGDWQYYDKNDLSHITRKPYSNHSWVYACCSAISQNISRLPQVLYNTSEPDELIREHPVLDILRRPNPMQTGREMREMISLFLNLPTRKTPGGQCFVLPYKYRGVSLEKVDLSTGDIPDQLWVYSDEQVSPLLDSKKEKLIGWKLEIGGKLVDTFTFDELIRIRRTNIDDWTKGQAPYQAAQIPVIQDTKADEYNTNFFDNNGYVGGTLHTDQNLTPSQTKEVMKSWNEKHAGAGNAGKVAVLFNGLKYEQHALKNVDMQYMDMRKDNRLRVQAVYRVPDAEIGIYESGMNRATAQQSDRNFWQKTLIPLDELIQEAFNVQWIWNIDGEDLRLKSDMGRIEALRADYSEQIKQAESLVKQTVPPAEAYRVIGLPIDVDKYPHLDTVYLNMNMTDIRNLDEMPDNSTTTPNNDNKKTIQKSSGIEKMIHRERMYQINDAHIKEVLNPGERSMEIAFHKLFKMQLKEMLKKIDDWLKDQKRAPEKVITPYLFLFDKTVSDEFLMRFYTEELEKQMKRATKKISVELQGLQNWKVTNEELLRFLDKRADIVKSINTTTYNKARLKYARTITEAVAEDWTPQETAKALEDAAKATMSIRWNNTPTIARTEIASISMWTRWEAFNAEGIKMWEWSHSRDEDVRTSPNHALEGNDAIRPIGESFPNNLRYPHDPAGSADNVINCRCVTVAVEED